MLRFLLILIFLYTSSDQAFSQLYSGKKGGMDFFVEVNENVAHVEIFTTDHQTYFVKKQNEEFLIPVKSGDTIFTGKENHLLKKGNKYRLVHIPWREVKTYGIKLKPCTNNSRTVLRNTAYKFEVRIRHGKPEVIHLDSNNRIASPTIFTTSEENTFDQDTDISPKDSIFTMKAGLPDDSLIVKQIRKDTLLHRSLKSATLKTLHPKVSQDHLVSNGNDFLNEPSVSQPENQIEENTFMKPEILNTIQVQGEYKEVVQKEKKVESSSPAQKEMLQPLQNRNISDSLMVTMWTLVIATEIAAVMSLAYWIFRSNSLSF